MEEKDDESLLKYLNENIYCKKKKAVLPINIHVEFNMIINYLMDIETIRTFYLREMHGIAWAKPVEGIKMDKNFLFYLMFPKRKDSFLKLKDFTINNINSKNILSNNYIYKAKIIYVGGWVNHKKIIKRFNSLNKTKKNSDNEISNCIDVVLSFYIDIKDNSTVIINEFFYDVNENEFSRFFEVFKIGFKKFQFFLEKNFNIYFCNESILINRNIKQIFNYIMNLKLFNNKRFEIKEIQKFKNEINIFVNIRDQQYPESVYISRCQIVKLSEISSFVTILPLIEVKFFNINERFFSLKAAIILVLKLLKKNIEKEMIETNN